MKKVLGIDIGISSVGWSVVNLDNGNLIDCGVRLFDEGTSENNLSRRVRRGARRLKRRRTNRIVDAKKLLESSGLILDEFESSLNPYECRIKGLNNKLTNEEFTVAYLHIVKRRGSGLEAVEDDETKTKEDESIKELLSQNDHLIREGKFPCEIQWDRFQKEGALRGSRNNFKTSHYVKELKQIFSNQVFDENFVNQAIQIVERRRKYWEGPGSEKSPSIYGRFVPTEDGTIVEIDLIEKMRGKCSVYPEELRAPKMAPSTELFNFLNDLNNLNISSEDEIFKLTAAQKEQILKEYIRIAKPSFTIAKLAKFLNVDEDSISGYRVDKNDKKLLTEFKGLKKIISVLFDSQLIESFINDFRKLDRIVEILTRVKGIEERRIELVALNDDQLGNIEIDRLIHLSGISEYHSISFKAIYEFEEELIKTNENQMQILARKGFFKTNIESLKGLRNIPSDKEAILSAVARKSQNETFKVINKVREMFGELDQIVVEMPRDKNSQEEKQRINKEQKKNEIINQNILDITKMEKVSASTKVKLRLYQEQDGKCLYTGTPLDLKLIMSDPHAYEIDHIIPNSISFDDSLQNKVLVTHQANHVKGNLTPFMAFQQKRFSGWDYETYYRYCFNLNKRSDNAFHISGKKLSYLFFDKDITKFDTLKDFIARNLVDTRYASRVVLNRLQDFFKANNIPTKVSTVKGAVTYAFRKRIDLEKSREENHYHHAVDATILAILAKQTNFNEIFGRISLRNDLLEFENSNFTIETNDDLFETSLMKSLSQVRQIKTTKISWKIDRKPNRQISDETIYSTRMIENDEVVIKKYKDIYDPKFMTLAHIIMEDGESSIKKDQLLLYRYDQKTYQKLFDVVRDYVDTIGVLKNENPFALYKQNHGYITKYAHKNNGAPVVSIRYFDGKLGNYIDISQNYITNSNVQRRKKVILQQISPYRTDFYINPNGLYRFVTIRFSNLKQKGEHYLIDHQWYELEKVRKGIERNAKFLFSLNRNDVIEIKKNNEQAMRWRFIATNNDKANVIEVKPIHCYSKNREVHSIGKSIESLKKYNVDVLGNLYQVLYEELTMSID